MKFSEDAGDPSYFPTPLTSCLPVYHVPFKRYSPLTLEIVNRTDVYSLLAPWHVLGG